MTVSITKAEREDLQRLVRQREKVLKSHAQLRSKELLADFENQMAAQYAFDGDAVWEAAAKEAEAEIRKAQEKIAARCNALGIPKQFAPGLSLSWRHRGYDNLVAERRAELRKAAQTQIAAMEQKAIVQIEQDSLEAQTQLAIAGLTSDAARSFVERLPSVETLMPTLSYETLAGEAEPPVIEQILTPGALRQRRYRERQKAALADVLRPRIDNAQATQQVRHGDGSAEAPDAEAEAEAE